jgi:hypothetical protein
MWMRQVANERTVVVTNHDLLAFHDYLAREEVVMPMDIEHFSRDLNSCSDPKGLQHLQREVRTDRDEKWATGIRNAEKRSSRFAGCVR